MPIEREIKKRLADALAKSYYVPWHKRWWGKFFIVFVVIFVIFLAYFGYTIADNLRYLAKGFVYDRSSGLWISPEQYQEGQKLTAEFLKDDDPWLGSDQPVLFIVAYESFTCPHCKANQKDIREFLGRYGSLVLYIAKDYPLEGIDPFALEAHLAAACADEQDKYWEYRGLLYDNQEDFSIENFKSWALDLGLNENQFNICLDNRKYLHEIRQDIAEAKQLKVPGTPTYMVNGAMIPGEIPYSVWEEILGVIIK